MAVPGLFWIELGLGVVLLLLSAKAHGRQIRLERELEGHFEVDFTGKNDPSVEALWKKDRRQYWITFPIAAIALAAYAVVAGLFGLPPHYGADPLGAPILGAVFLAVFLWAPVATFVANGLTSALRFRAALNRKGRDGPGRNGIRSERGNWSAAVTRGTYAYWGFVAALVVAAIAVMSS